MRNIVLRTFCHAAAIASMLSMPALVTAQETRAEATVTLQTVKQTEVNVPDYEIEKLYVDRMAGVITEAIIRLDDDSLLYLDDGRLLLELEGVGVLEGSYSLEEKADGQNVVLVSITDSDTGTTYFAEIPIDELDRTTQSNSPVQGRRTPQVLTLALATLLAGIIVGVGAIIAVIIGTPPGCVDGDVALKACAFSSCIDEEGESGVEITYCSQQCVDTAFSSPHWETWHMFISECGAGMMEVY